METRAKASARDALSAYSDAQRAIAQAAKLDLGTLAQAVQRVNAEHLQQTLDAAAKVSSGDLETACSFASTVASHWVEMKKVIDDSMVRDLVRHGEEMSRAYRNSAMRDFLDARKQTAESLAVEMAAALPTQAVLDETARSLAGIRPPEMRTFSPPSVEYLPAPRNREAELEQRVADLEQSHAAAEAENRELRQRIVQIDHRTERMAEFFVPDPSGDEDEPEQPLDPD